MPRTRTALAHLWKYAVAVSIPAVLLGVIAMWPGQPSGVAGATVIGVDANPSGNSANALGTREACVEVDVGEDFDVDVYIEGANDLKAWELYFGFDPALVSLRDPASDLAFLVPPDFQQEVPDANWLFVGAVTTGPGVNGEGVLGRIHLHAKSQGVSEASVRTVPAPPYLSTTSGATSHLNPIINAQIAIGQSCAGAPTLPPTPTAPPTLPPTPSPTPTQAPTPTQTVGGPGNIPWGDANCMQSVTANDAVAITQLKAGVPVTPKGSPCPNVGDDLIGGEIEVEWGDFNCDGLFNLGDAIAILRYLIGITNSNDGCPSIATNYVSIP
jgi:hypothetical protein